MNREKFKKDKTHREQFKRRLTHVCVHHTVSSDPSVLLADVGRNVILTSGCIVGACCRLNTCEEIPENTVIYGSNCMRRVQTERPQVTHTVTQRWAQTVCSQGPFF